jgi:hypothetical protein
MEAIKETRGKKPLKTYKIEAGTLRKFNINEEANVRYRARRENWKIKIRKINGKLWVFRQS